MCVLMYLVFFIILNSVGAKSKNDNGNNSEHPLPNTFVGGGTGVSSGFVSEKVERLGDTAQFGVNVIATSNTSEHMSLVETGRDGMYYHKYCLGKE